MERYKTNDKQSKKLLSLGVDVSTADTETENGNPSWSIQGIMDLFPVLDGNVHREINIYRIADNDTKGKVCVYYKGKNNVKFFDGIGLLEPLFNMAVWMIKNKII